MISQNELPKHWKIAKHFEVADINPKLPFEKINDDAEVSFIPMRLVEEKNNVIHLTDFKKYKDVRKGFTPFTNGDVIFAKITPCMENGKCAVVHDLKNEIGFGSTEFHVSRSRGGILPQFIFYFIVQEQFRRIAENNMTGSVGQKRVPTVFFREFEIPLPPLPEQESIVAKIEELFSELDTGLESLKTAQSELKTYRQSILKYAFEGKLTEGWRKRNRVKSAFKQLKVISQNRKHAFEEAKKKGIKKPIKNYDFAFAQSDEVVGWATAKLDKLIYIAGRIGWRGLKKDEYTSQGPLFLSVHSLNYGKYVEFKDAFHISNERYEESPEIMLQDDDILLCKDGAGIGKIGIIKNLPYEATVNSSLLVIRGLEIFVPEFLFYLFSGPKLQRIVQERITGSATPHLFQNDIRQFELLIPPIEEQQQIVEEIESRLSVCDKLEETINSSLKQSESLRQSILKQAFEGKLIAQEKEIQVLSDKQIRFRQLQVLGLILLLCRSKNIRHGQMTSAKYLYLLDKIYGIKTYYDFKRGNLGPFPSDFKKIVYNPQYFVHKYGQIEVTNENRLFNSPNPHKQEIENAIYELADVFNSFTDPKIRPHKTELLATVCKVIEDIQTTEIEAVRQSMLEWKINLKDKKFNNKAEKFNDEETAKCIEFIIKKGWDKKLIQ